MPASSRPSTDRDARPDRLPLALKLGLLATLYIGARPAVRLLQPNAARDHAPAGLSPRVDRLLRAAHVAVGAEVLVGAARRPLSRADACRRCARRRKRWILACQLAATFAFLALALYGRIDRLTPPLFVGFLLLNFVSATQDIATDGFAVDLLAGSERGYANGIQVAGYRGGMVASGGVLLIVLERIGARTAFSILAVATVVLSLPLLFVREAPPRVDEAKTKPPLSACRTFCACAASRRSSSSCSPTSSPSRWRPAC